MANILVILLGYCWSAKNSVLETVLNCVIRILQVILMQYEAKFLSIAKAMVHPEAPGLTKPARPFRRVMRKKK